MTEEKAINEVQKILKSKELTVEKIKTFFTFEQYIADYIFGDLIEALLAITPENLINEITEFEK